ncbi:arsenate reductase family protein [Paenibacillus sambharensis]|uniref:Arsenate reductase family protein n=1 Tax=Paenibacillus sambharensis TaxID=1803190 RepID=A0A2W1L4Y9_9BACL|nr:arsenate reductase family protein [Paenibacillus sambharensis]PZD95148.1 arsenate reductase family protein [Paenibacillus sambharensis]
MSKTLKVYYYPKCGTCRNALKWLEARGFELELQNLFEQAPTEGEIREWLELSGLDVKKFFNTSGEVYKEQQLKDKLPGMTQEEKVAALAANGRLVKRPVVTDGSRLTVGFKEAEFEQVWAE